VPVADVLLHPVRLRIVQAFLGGRQLTTGQLGVELPDVTQASLYRNVARLVEAGILVLVSERQARGAVERTYGLRLDATRMSAGEVAALTRDELAQAFAIFTSVLMSSFDRYLAHSESAPDLVRDGVSYSMNALWLSDEEFVDFVVALAAVIAPYAAQGPGQGRRRRMTASALFPMIGDDDA